MVEENSGHIQKLIFSPHFAAMAGIHFSELIVTSMLLISWTPQVSTNEVSPELLESRVISVFQGAGIRGWSLYAKDGKLKHCYNFFGIENYFAESEKEIPAGMHQVRMEFAYDGGCRGQNRRGLCDR